ncbi:PREDICTED: WAT1-related protein At2g37460-like [Erythranthe guttata]|uniref:WAT1-related protein At2g37460-like n=1 Tax=Erythranthe guttata TaxID=4155 RepID=UPI00064DD133|nr:PREDICTED: WAT1-related protein At2g37460-like [Erythranthe guttata]|eukprot:XP_012847465.1 PREDICTED: WAT1-related protein At2g37460-like [Erythranthe guttata]
MKYTSATFIASMTNVLPAVTFVIACLLRHEKVKMTSTHSQAKIIGTLVSIGGAMIMTLVRGPNLDLPWTRGNHQDHKNGEDFNNSIKGALMIAIASFAWAGFMISHAITLQTYPAALSLTAWICMLGTVEGAALALIMERGNSAVWSIKWDTKLLGAVYSGIFCSGITYYVQGIVLKERGPVFVTAFSPLSMVLVAVMSSFILREQMYLGRYREGGFCTAPPTPPLLRRTTTTSSPSLTSASLKSPSPPPSAAASFNRLRMGRVIGAIVIITGLYLFVWGKKKDYESPLVEDQEMSVHQSTNAGDAVNA